MKQKTRQEALAVAGGMYRMNAPYARVYAFTERDGVGGVCSGEFLSFGDVEELLSFDRFDGFVQLNAATKDPIGCVQALKPGRVYAFFDGWVKMAPKNFKRG